MKAILMATLIALPLIAAFSDKELKKIGSLIYQNEASGRKELIVFWDIKEPYPSLGIGHNIWLASGESQFNYLCRYLRDHCVTLPSWLEKQLPIGMPWKNRDAFYSDSVRLGDLHKLLDNTIELQTRFMINCFKTKMPQIIAHAPQNKRDNVSLILSLMLDMPMGAYALVDYMNFKGDGAENNGNGYGLLAVLCSMPIGLRKDNVIRSFSVHASRKIVDLVDDSYPDYHRIDFIDGWIKRISSYADR